jgi:hypothetical protein
MDTNYGFIISRHVNSEKTNKYWNNNVKLLRTFYPNKLIVIIDDNSKQEYVKADFHYKNIKVIQSEFPGRGELLPYYYFYKNKFFDNAIIIHDSTFIHKKINFEKILGHKVLPLWHFDSDTENLQNTQRIASSLSNNIAIQQRLSLNENILGLIHLKWVGIFGVQSFINHTFLCQVQNKYNIFNMISVIKNRKDRCCLERIMGAIFSTEVPRLNIQKSLFGRIFDYQTWGYSYEQYTNDIKNGRLPKLVVKIWSGR